MCRSQTDFFGFWHAFPLFCQFSDFAHFAFLAVFYPHIFGSLGSFSAFQYWNFTQRFSKIQNI